MSQQRELFNAIGLGLPLGVLAAKYIPSMQDEAGDAQRRGNYTRLLQSAVDELNITLNPRPSNLLSAGRGQRQYETIESYFRQIIKQAEKHSPCIRSITGLSLNSAWLILGYHEVQNLYRGDLPLFKRDYLTRLDQFSGLSAGVSFICRQPRTLTDGANVDFFAKLDAVSKESRDWYDRISQANNNDIVTEVVSFGKTLADWLNELAELASGLSTQ